MTANDFHRLVTIPAPARARCLGWRSGSRQASALRWAELAIWKTRLPQARRLTSGLFFERAE